jgi:L-arabinose transport system ATP-binding protein
MTNQGKIIILVSSDMDELLSICDTIGIMRDGEMVKIIPKREISQELFLSYAIGGAK